MSFTRPLAAIRPADRALVGGKAVGCAELVRLGLPVPPGFVLTTQAFEGLLAQDGLGDRWSELLAAFVTEPSEEELARRCAELHAAVLAAGLPAGVQQALREGLDALDGPVAVRSSATLEDGQATAFAGVFCSELDVAGADVDEAVSRCWAHAFDYTVVTHALRNNLDPARLRVALLVQQMVPAERAGVLFTRDPTGAAPDTAVASFTQGSGEALMQGELEGSSVHLDRRKGCPDDPLLDRVLRTGLRIERQLGGPQDIEWAASGGELRYLQTRPITTLEPRRGIHWTRELTEERFPRPISPLGWSTLQNVLRVNVDTLRERFGLEARHPNDVARTIGHYVYSNKRFFSIPGSLRPNLLTQARTLLPRFVRQGLNALWHLPAALFSRGFGLRWLALSRVFRAFISPHADDLRQQWDRSLAEHLRHIDAFEAVDPESLSAEQLCQHQEDMDEAGRRYMEPDLAIYVVKMACSWVIGQLGKQLRGRNQAEFLADLTGGLPANRTLEMNLELEALATSLRADPALVEDLRAERYDEALAALAGEARQAFDAFVARNGHLTTNWDLMEPTWGEEPSQVLRMVRAQVLGAGQRSFREFHEQQANALTTRRGQVLEVLPSWLRSFFEEVLGDLHEFMRIDEEHHFYCSRLFRSMRRLYRTLARRLVESGALRRAEDIWFLTTQEVAAAVKHPFPRRYLVQARRASFARALTLRPPYSYLDQAPQPESTAGSAAPVAGTVLRGTGASPGRVSGVVRVVESPADVAAFQPGEILVTTTPNPALTPVYAVAGGMVTATGSVLSHGLVSAREYHLPAVTGIADAVRRLPSGTRIEVDGDGGLVTLEGGPGLTTVLFDLDGTLVRMRRWGLSLRFLLLAAWRMSGIVRPWKFRRVFWEAVAAMRANETERTNYQVMLEAFGRHSSRPLDEVEQGLRDIIALDFPRLSDRFVAIPGARETLEKARSLGYRLVLATNPVWPEAGVQLRLRFAGLDDIPFEFVTHSEVMTRTKPRPAYYRELLERLDLPPEQCIMIGNDPVKDLPAREVGITTFILDIPGVDVDSARRDPRLDRLGSWQDLQELLERCANQRKALPPADPG